MMGSIFRVGYPPAPEGEHTNSLIFLQMNKSNFALQEYTKWKIQ